MCIGASVTTIFLHFWIYQLIGCIVILVRYLSQSLTFYQDGFRTGWSWPFLPIYIISHLLCRKVSRLKWFWIRRTRSSIQEAWGNVARGD
ncbi:hypothetical protein RIF29_08234 [Crotalaria pallida]|uniref:Uncharacterized protein n=1 Tax=Crotalaria pallida TaxID=3830 RepID=A0AAN9J6W6_CROPI